MYTINLCEANIFFFFNIKIEYYYNKADSLKQFCTTFLGYEFYIYKMTI